MYGLIIGLMFRPLACNCMRTLYCQSYGGDFGDFFEYGRIDGVISVIGLIYGCIGEVV